MLLAQARPTYAMHTSICIPYPEETNKARQARTDANRVAQQVCRQNEPHDIKQARLDALRLAQQHRIDNETPAERQARLEAIRLAHLPQLSLT